MMDTLVKDDLQTWSNIDNTELYENLPLEEFYKIAWVGGLDSGKDIEILMPYVRSANSILEVGAGYGRVLNHLIIRGYDGKLTGIERSKKLCQWLKSQYAPRVSIYQDSIMSMNNQEKYDLILWMWTGLAEFAKSEQSSALKKLAAHLIPEGKIILDMVPLNEKTLNTLALAEQEHIIETKYGTDHCYIPSEREIYAYAEQIGLPSIEKISYKSLPDRTRCIYILSR